MNFAQSSRQRFQLFVDDYYRIHRERVEPDHGFSPECRGAKDKARARRWSCLHAYVTWMGPHRYAVGALIALALLATSLQIIEPLCMRFILDTVLSKGDSAWAARLVILHSAGALFLVLVVSSNLVNAWRDYRQSVVSKKITVALRRSLFGRMVLLPLPQLRDMKVGGILTRLSGDVDMATALLQMAILSPIVSGARVIVVVIVLISLNRSLGFVCLAVILCATAASFSLSKLMRPVYRSLRTDVEVIDARVVEVFSGIRVVRAFRRERSELLEYVLARHTAMRKELFVGRRETALWTFWYLLLGCTSVAIVWYGAFLYLHGRATIGDIMASQWYMWQLATPFMNIVTSVSELQGALASVERVFDVLAMKSEGEERRGGLETPKMVHEIRFEQVTFEYQMGRPVVRDFDVIAPEGTVVALVGRSGAGKTTVTDMLARFLEPTGGRILLNGVDIREFSLRSYRSLVAVVQQDVFLFDGSVYENIAYGRCDATLSEVQNVARWSNAHEFIMNLPEQYDTVIGERGTRLSGGQQQRISIARAILASPQILILDEATSNLDSESEQVIQESMALLLAGRTTFIIAHRLSTVRRADVILFMENGRIVERGTHDELMRGRGAYHRMVVRQMDYHTEDEMLL